MGVVGDESGDRLWGERLTQTRDGRISHWNRTGVYTCAI